jgi:uncharacterized spore protein YtfJ
MTDTDATTDAHETGTGIRRDVAELARDTIEELQHSAHADRVYGDPIEVDGKTVVPVARIVYGFGGGFGSGAADEGETGSGGGGGGGARATPVGVLEVTPETTRFVRFSRGWRLAALVLAVGVGYLLGRLTRE